MPNLYLIGMPGSGKSTLAPLAAGELGLVPMDLDACIEQQENATINQIFQQKGEAAFRTLERKILQEYAVRHGFLIATGGGIILDPANVLLMQKSGLVVYLNRSLDLLIQEVKPTKRPLLQGDTEKRLRQLYAQRQKLYETASHVTLVHDGDTGLAAQKLIDLGRAYFNQKAL